MNRTIVLGGVDHLIVTPSKQMHNSGMVKDVLRTGGLFVVNLQNGVLGIHRPKQKAYFLQFCNGNSVQLASEAEVAMLQISDYFNAGNYAIKAFVIMQGEEEIFRTTHRSTPKEFMRQATYAFHNI